MSNEGKGKGASKIVAVALAVVAAGALAVGLYFTVGKGGETSADRMAGILPEDTTLLVWTGAIDELMAIAGEAGLDGEALAAAEPDFGEVVKKLGANPLTVEGLKTLGVDPSAAVGFSLVPAKDVELLMTVNIPLLEGKSAVELAKEVITKLELAKEVQLDEAEQNGRRLAWVRPILDGQAGPVVAAIMDLDEAGLVVFPGKQRRRLADAIEQQVKAYVPKLGGDSGTLAQVEAYSDAVSGGDAALLGAFFNPGPDTRELSVDDGGMQLFFWVAASALGIGGQVVVDGQELALKFRSVLVDSQVAAARQRDLEVLDLVPGQPIAGLHLAVDLGKVVEELRKTLPSDAFNSHTVVKTFTSPDGIPGLPEGTTLMEILDGELGFFLGELTGDPKRSVQSVTAFIGVKDQKSAEGMLVELLRSPGTQAGEEKVGDTTIHTLDFFGEMTAGFMFLDNRLWLAGSVENLRKIAEGKKGGLTEGERNSKIASVMRTEGALAMYVDLPKVIEGVAANMGRRAGDREGPLWGLLDELDYLTFEASLDGNVVASKIAVMVQGESFRKSALPKLAALLAPALGRVGTQKEYSVKTKGGREFVGAVERRGKTEAIDQLDKIYRSATMYYEAPRVSMEGMKLPCQFPASQPATPAATCCKEQGGPDADGDGRCDADYTVWDTATWAALMFQQNDPHSCVYSFESTGIHSEAQFTATAHCDVDCDGVMSTFQRFGRGSASATSAECMVEDSAGIYMENEGE